jgi:hypothetical protein
MATNLAINPKLLDEALKAGGQKTKKVTVEGALKEYISRRTGIREKHDFDELRKNISAFPHLDLESSDHERAAEIFNACRAVGIHANHCTL